MIFKQSKSMMCEECGSGAVNHRAKYITVAVNDVFGHIFSFTKFARPLFARMHYIEHFVSYKLFNLCVLVGVANKNIEIDNETALLAQMLWREAESRGIKVWEFRLFNLPRNLFVAEFRNGGYITYEGVPVPPSVTRQEKWIDDKSILKRRFMKLDLPVAKGGAVMTKNGAIKLFEKLQAPVIVKPHSGSGSRHTTLHIIDEKELLRAFDVAVQVSPFAVIEEELVGAVYRATVVDGRLIATLRRDPPSVVGDGKKTIHELIDEANKHPARSGPYFSEIKIDSSALKELDWQKHTLGDVLPKGKRATFHQKVNWSVGGTTADVSDEVHPDNVALFERVAEVLKAPIVGIDFIIGDISRSWKEQERCGIIECNSMPFFDNHHLPFEGKPRNVAGAIWDMVEN